MGMGMESSHFFHFPSRVCRRNTPRTAPPLPSYLLRPNVGLLIETIQVTHSEGTRPMLGR